MTDRDWFTGWFTGWFTTVGLVHGWSTVEFTAVVWVALDPHERGSAEIGKTMAFLRSVAALHSVGGGLMRAQGLHRTLVDAFRLHGGGGGVQAMSEIVRSPYNPGTAARAAQSFA